MQPIENNLNPELDFQKLFSELTELISSDIGFAAINQILVEDFVTSIDFNSNYEIEDRLNISELIFLLSVFAPNILSSHQTLPRVSILTEVQAGVIKIRQLMRDIHLTMIPALDLESIDEDKGPSDHYLEVMLKEAFFYNGVLGSDIQYFKFIESRFFSIDRITKEQYGFDSKDLKECFLHIQKILFKRHQAFIKEYHGKQKNRTRVNELFIISAKELFVKTSFKNIVLTFLCLKEHVSIDFHHPSHTPLRGRPILRVGKNSFWIPSTYLLMQSFFYFSSTVFSEARKKGINLSQLRGVDSEKLAITVLSELKGDFHLSTNSRIERVKGKPIGEIDILVESQNYKLVFEVKSKSIPLSAQRGSISELRKHLSESLEHPATQIQKLVRELSTTEKRDYEVFGICLLTDSIPALPIIEKIQFESKYDDIIFLNLFDLDLVIGVLRTFDNLCDYLKWKIKHKKHLFHSSEADLLKYFVRNDRDLSSGNEIDNYLIEEGYGDDLTHQVYFSQFQKTFGLLTNN